MASGQQVAEVNYQRFIVWLASKSEDDFRQLVNKRDGVLSRKGIAAECGFGGSALKQNPRINEALLAKEAELRKQGVLPLLVEKMLSNAAPTMAATPAPTAKPFDAERLRRLELENASLKAENQELKRQLSKFGVLREVLSTTGRPPR